MSTAGGSSVDKDPRVRQNGGAGNTHYQYKDGEFVDIEFKCCGGTTHKINVRPLLDHQRQMLVDELMTLLEGIFVISNAQFHQMVADQTAVLGQLKVAVDGLIAQVKQGIVPDPADLMQMSQNLSDMQQVVTAAATPNAGNSTPPTPTPEPVAPPVDQPVTPDVPSSPTTAVTDPGPIVQPTA